MPRGRKPKGEAEAVEGQPVGKPVRHRERRFLMVLTEIEGQPLEAANAQEAKRQVKGFLRERAEVVNDAQTATLVEVLGSCTASMTTQVVLKFD